jgi:hypothetical protein
MIASRKPVYVDGMDSNLTARWKPVTLDPRQRAFYMSKARVNLCHSGRRSWKTEGAARRLVRNVLRHHKFSDAMFWAGAPTHQQAKRIWWKRLKAYMPEWAYLHNSRRSRSESELHMQLFNGATLTVVGLDEPARIEGLDWDGGAVDEFDNCKANVLEHIRPMMMRGGYLDILGVPEGKRQMWQLRKQIEQGEIPNSAIFHWPTDEVLHLWLGRAAAEAELAEAQKTLDERSYSQEYGGAFVSMEGRAYYTFDPDIHAARPLPYKQDQPLIFCFDFNKAPGTATILQEQFWPSPPDPRFANKLCCALDEVYIKRNSNTLMVCTELSKKLAKWNHRGDVYVYGDATGGAGGSAKIAGSDWDLIEEAFADRGDRMKYRYRRKNPKPRIRVNALCSRFMTADGKIHMLVDPHKCPNFIEDLDSVQWNEDGTDLDKRKDEYTHMTDGTGYWAWCEYPVGYNAELQESVI